MRTPRPLLACSLLVVLALSSTAGPVRAEGEIATPTNLPGGKVVTVEEVRKLLADGGVAVFDMRKPLNYGKGHLKGAVSLPYDQKSGKAADFDAALDTVDLSKLPTDLKASVLFYSDGPTGWKSYKAAVLAIRRGYTSVLWMRDGTDGWINKGFLLE